MTAGRDPPQPEALGMCEFKGVRMLELLDYLRESVEQCEWHDLAVKGFVAYVDRDILNLSEDSVTEIDIREPSISTVLMNFENSYNAMSTPLYQKATLNKVFDFFF
ncbi:hypothetical protein M8C21_003527, partial [Ambrosia artemisiifolia]